MAQCTYIDEDKQRCSNQAVPGKELCQRHAQQEKRIKFSRVPKVTTPAAKGEATWQASASSATAKVTFPGLRRDRHGLLVAARGCIWLAPNDPQRQQSPLRLRLQQLLAQLSYLLPLDEQIELYQLADEAGILLTLGAVPNQPEEWAARYDAVATAADLCGGLLYIGQERLFIQYRDGAAPHGYDASDVKAPPADAWWLIDNVTTRRFRHATPLKLSELLLQMAPLPDREAPSSERLFALADSALYPMVARYLRAHHLAYRIARLRGSQPARQLTLFEIMPNPAATRPPATAGAIAPGKEGVPTFVRNYLAALPRTAVLYEQYATADQQLLVQWGLRQPCQPAHFLAAFPAHSLLLVMDHADFANLCLSPAPAWFEGATLATPQAPRSAQSNLQALTQSEGLALAMPLRLAARQLPAVTTSALLLDAQELRWLRRLLYRLPERAFAHYRLCLGKTHSLLLSERLPIEGIPFGLALRRHQQSALYLPLDSRLLPELPWSLLASTLKLAPDQLTFLTSQLRIDLPQSAFLPLSRALLVEPRGAASDFALQAPPVLPTLQWKLPTPPASSGHPQATLEKPASATVLPVGQAPPIAPESRPRPGLLDRLFGSGSKESAVPVSGRQTTVSEKAPSATAQQLLAQEDYLAAAVYFMLAGEAEEAARWYREAARTVGQ